MHASPVEVSRFVPLLGINGSYVIRTLPLMRQEHQQQYCRAAYLVCWGFRRSWTLNPKGSRTAFRANLTPSERCDA